MRIIGTTVAALATAAMLSSLATPASAFTARFDDLVTHFLECKMLLLTDFEAHARECGGGTMPTSFQSLSEKVDGPPAQTIVVSAPAKEECQYGEGDEGCECKHERND
jgi:hypothetical protein